LANTPVTEDHRQQTEAIQSQIGNEKAVHEHRRDKITRGTISWCARGIIVLAFILFAVAIVTMGHHTFAPDEYHWLEPEKIQEIKGFLLSGAAVSMAMTYMRKYF